MSGGKLAFAVIRKMPAGLVQLQPADVRRENLLIPLPAELLADEILQLNAHFRALGLPQHQALADFLIDGEQPQLRADDAMVALLGFFELLEVLLEVFFVEERGAVDAGELLAIAVAAPVRPGDAQ